MTHILVQQGYSNWFICWNQRQNTWWSPNTYFWKYSVIILLFNEANLLEIFEWAGSYTCCTMYIYMYGVDTKIWMAFFEILLYRTCTCKRKLFALWDCWSWVWVLLIGRPFDGCDFIHVLLAMLPLVVKDLLYTVHVHIHAHVKLSWSLSNCVIHIPLKALVSVTYTCISTIYCILGNVPPFYFHPLCPRCHQQIYLSLSQLCPGEFKMGQNCLQV